MFRWSVPVFVMISGALFLKKDIEIKSLYKKYILRIVFAYIFWSLLYAFIDFLRGQSIKGAIISVFEGKFHLWFLFMIAGLYMIIPFIKKIIANKQLTIYFIILFVIFAVILPQSINIISVFNEGYGLLMKTILDKVNLNFVLGFAGYFILGYFLSANELTKKTRILIYLLGLFGFISTVLLTSIISKHLGKASELFYSSFSINVFLESLSIFVFFKYNFSKIMFPEKIKKIITMLSKLSFGVYLSHIMVLEFLDKTLGINSLSFNPIISIIILPLMIVVGSLCVSWVCNHIPLLKKYIV